MHYQQGNMRELNYDNSPSRQSWVAENDFQYTQRSKYEKSEISYAHQQKSKVHYDYDGDRTIKNKYTENKEIQKSIPFKLKSSEHEDRFVYLQVQMYISTEKNSSTFTMHFTDDKDSYTLNITQVIFVELLPQGSRVPFTEVEAFIESGFPCFSRNASRTLRVLQGSFWKSQ